MNTLSLTLITRNEEKHLVRVLEHAHLFADEIVVVDTGSEDRTLEVAGGFTDHIYEFKWVDDFSKARNHGIERCSCDFIMWLDADDFISRPHAQAIRDLLSQPLDEEIIYVPYYTAFDASGRPKRKINRERIFRNGLGIRFKYPIHEVLNFPRKMKSMTVDHIFIEHRKEHRWQPRGERNLNILRRSVETDEYRNSARMWWYLAREERPEKAICLYRNLLQEIAAGDPRKMRSRYWYELADKCFLAKRYDAALEALGQSITLCPLWREPFFLAGRIHWRQKNYDEALVLMKLAGEIPYNKEFSLDFSLYDGYPYYDHLSLAYARVHDYRGAIGAVMKALERLPGDRRFLDHLRSWQKKLEAQMGVFAEGVPEQSGSEASDAELTDPQEADDSEQAEREDVIPDDM